jgi:hypothetical protein
MEESNHRVPTPPRPTPPRPHAAVSPCRRVPIPPRPRLATSSPRRVYTACPLAASPLLRAVCVHVCVYACVFGACVLCACVCSFAKPLGVGTRSSGGCAPKEVPVGGSFRRFGTSPCRRGATNPQTPPPPCSVLTCTPSHR